MPVFPGGPQGSQACSSAAWDWGPAWSPMYPSNHALELRILPHQMGWCTGCLPLGVLGSLALQGCMGLAGSRSCLTHRYARFSSHHGSLGPWLWPSEGRGRCVRRALCSQLSPTPLPPATSREKVLSTPAPHKEADRPNTSHSHPSLLSPTNAGRLTPLHSESQDDKNCCLSSTAPSLKPSTYFVPRNHLVKEEGLAASHNCKDRHQHTAGIELGMVWQYPALCH